MYVFSIVLVSVVGSWMGGWVGVFPFLYVYMYARERGGLGWGASISMTFSPRI